MSYIIVDSLNLFSRARHAAPRMSDIWDKCGFALHVCFFSVNSLVKKFPESHVVFVMEGRSWRKNFYPPYKKNRQILREEMTIKEKEEDELFFQAYKDMMEFFSTRTNCTVLHQESCEGDDLIARWIALHPSENHVIVSTDTDFYQLLKQNVRLYNGITEELHTVDGIFNKNGDRVIDKKTKTEKLVPDPDWILFEKCIRGDKGDNVFAAYPGARLKGTKKKIGITEAWQDREKQGFNWNSFMLSKWTDHNGEEHRVLDDYLRNKILIDLAQQPQWVIELADSEIKTKIACERKTQVGLYFLKFCGKYDLVKLSDNTNLSSWMSVSYNDVKREKTAIS